MSYADLNRRLSFIETARPNDCPACRDQPALSVLLPDDPVPAPCALCGRDPNDASVIRIGVREDGPQ